jgi:uncharacterized phiE125 gp8 family phage protein
MASSRVLITPPTADVLSRDDVKKHLRVDFDDDNALIDGMIAAAVNQLDPAGGGWLGRALRPQTWEVRLPSFWQHDCFDHRYGVDAIVLPYPPLISIVSVKYDDPAGLEQTLDDEGIGFRLLGLGSFQKQAIAPPYQTCWPSARCDSESVRIRFTSGYPVAAAAHDDVAAVVDRLPAPILVWLKLYIGSLYENRESMADGGLVAELPPHIMQMISTYRVYG